jgi:hypothetical protein
MNYIRRGLIRPQLKLIIIQPLPLDDLEVWSYLNVVKQTNKKIQIVAMFVIFSHKN